MWRPILIGAFYYAKREDGALSRRNFVLRKDAVTYCAQLNAQDRTRQEIPSCP